LLFNPEQQVFGQEDDKKVVYFVPLHEVVERGLEAFLGRAIETAAEEGADHIILEIDTPGGRVDAAGNIAEILRDSKVPITAYVTKEAISAGAYISLNANQIVMKPATTMGAAAVIDQEGNMADKKTVSYWLKEMEASAELHNRDPIYARAMADPSVEIPELNLKKDELLTLSAEEALEVGYAEAIAGNRTELLQFLNMENAKIVNFDETFADKIARFVTHPVVVPILLSIGSLGLVLELYSPGFGIPGFLGLSSLLLFFFGHMIAGLAGLESIILFVVGLALVILEIFIPGGIMGVIGVIAVFASIIIAGGSLGNILLSLIIALTVTVIVSIYVLKNFGYRGPLRKLILFDSTKTESGYVSNIQRTELIGLVGVTLTPLRPSGTMLINEDRLDVVTEGSYVGINKQVKIIKTEGSRIIVREVKQIDQEEDK
jgi:membrane-bound serine protease (ClpP class)